MTGILILIGRLRCFKEVTLMDMILDKFIFQNRFIICCWYTFELPLYAPIIYVHSLNSVFTIHFSTTFCYVSV